MTTQRQKIQVRVERVVYPKVDEDLGGAAAFHIFRSDAGTCKGKLSHRPKCGEVLELEGKWEVSKYNGQPEFAFFHASVSVPKDERTMLKYACEMTSGFGPATEDAVWAALGEKWREIGIGDVPGVSAAKVNALQDTISFIETHAEKAETIAWLISVGCTTRLAEAAFARWKARTREVVQEDCYKLATLPHFSFKDVDSHVRVKFGIGRNDPRRIDACLNHYVRMLTEEDTVALWCEVYGAAARAIDADPAEITERCSALMRANELIPFKECGGISRPKDFEAETGILNFALNAAKDELPHVKAKQPKAREFDLDDAQMDAVQNAIDHRFAIINGGAGAGKCLGRGTPVIMFDFTVKNVEDIRAGDILLGPNGEPKHVISTTNGREEMFRVTPKKGDSFTCNRSHILSVIHSRKCIKKYTDDAKKPFNVSVDEIVTEMKPEIREHLKCWRPGSIQRQYKTVAVDPYFVGLWLGDGSSGDKVVRITNPDHEIISWLNKFAHDVGVKLSMSKPYHKHSCPILSMTSLLGRVRGSNVLKNAMRSVGLLDGEKHIPFEYIDNSEDVRLNLLAGLIDTDGYYSRRGMYEITQKNEALAREIVFVARSLGFGATIRKTQKRCCNNGKWGDYWRIYIAGDLDRIPCIVERKKAGPRMQIKNPRVSCISIESIGIGDYYGFTLAEEDGLFLLGDFTVTHNTSLIQSVCESLESAGQRVALCAFAGKAAARLKEATCHDASTIHRLLCYMGDERGFTLKTLRGVSVVLDEASMVSSDLMYEIVKRNPDRLVLVGDEAQLPPVGSGQPFHDLIKLCPSCVRTLAKCYRSREAVFSSALAIRNGQIPQREAKSENEHFAFVSMSDERAAHKFVTDAVRNGKIDFSTDILLCCRNGESDGSTPCSVESLNRDIKDIVNPNAKVELGPDGKPREVELNDRERYRVAKGDRVINTKNDTSNDVWNGTTGVCDSFDTDGGMWVKLDYPRADGSTSCLVQKADVINWKLAYALTVHKSQGSQYRRVVFCVTRRDENALLSRPMVYTAVTRTKRECIVVGDFRAFAASVAKTESKRTVMQEVAK